MPDGGILLTVIKANRPSIAVLAPGSTIPRLLIESGGHARYVATGHLVYVAREKLMAVAFDPRRLETRGGEIVVAEGLYEDRGSSSYDVSSTGTLIYRPATSADATIVWKDRRGATQPVVTRPRGYEFPALSPSGDRFSVNVIEPGPRRNIWAGRLANEPLTRLTFGDDDWYGVWSRDGTRLFYTSFVGGAYNISWISTDGSGKSGRLTESPNAQAVTSASPDRDTLLFDEIDPKTGGDICALSLSTNKSHPIVRTSFYESGARFSPDGRSIAYVSNETRSTEIYVQAYPGPGVRKQVSVDGGESPFWSHSGRELFYQTSTAMFAVPIVDTATLRIGAPVRLFSHLRINGFQPSISADDQRFLLLEKAASVPSQLNLVQGWFEELKARVK